MVKIFLMLKFLLLPIVNLHSCGTNKNISNIKFENIDRDSLLIDKIYRLKEVQAKEKYLRQLSNGKGHISIMILSKPEKKNQYYIIQVGYTTIVFYFKVNNRMMNKNK